MKLRADSVHFCKDPTTQPQWLVSEILYIRRVTVRQYQYIEYCVHNCAPDYDDTVPAWLLKAIELGARDPWAWALAWPEVASDAD